MTTNTKGTAKSCRCYQCKIARHTDAGHVATKHEQRSARRNDKAALRKNPLEALVFAGHRGDRIG